MPLFNYRCVACGYTSEEFMPTGVDIIQCQVGTNCTGLAKKVEVGQFAITGLGKKLFLEDLCILNTYWKLELRKKILIRHTFK